MSISNPLRIAVLGAGAIGSAYAFHLARHGHDVTAVARPGSDRLRRLQQDVGIVDAQGERVAVRVDDSLDEDAPYDLVIVTLLAHQIDAVLPALQRSQARAIQFMFNTFDPERLRVVGAARCALGMPFIQSQIDKDGRLHATIGAGGQKSLMDRQRWVEMFSAAGLPAALEPDMALWLRCHAPMCVAFESVSVAGVRRGGGASWDEAMTIARGARESFVLIRRLGYRIYPRSKALLSASPATVLASVLWGMSRIASFRELLATGANECRALVDAMVATASTVTPPIDVALIQAMKPSIEV